MGYSHGTKWTEDVIKQKLDSMIAKFNMKVFPTAKQLKDLNGNCALSSAIYKTGGAKYWAGKTNLPLKKCETFFAEEYEEECANKLFELGYEVEQMTTKFPYDLTANKHIKIDVKVGRLYTNYKIGSFYTFNLEKKNPTCDVYVCYCINEINEIDKVYIVPSKIMYGKKQLSVGQNTSIYDIYKDNWNILKTYDDFYKQFGA